MKVLIDNSGYGLYNMGDVAMLQAAISRLKGFSSDIDLQVFTTSPERLHSFCPEATAFMTNGRDLYLQPWNILGGLNKIIPKQFNDVCLDGEDWFRLSFPNFSHPWIKYRLAQRGENIKLIDNYLNAVAETDLVIATGGGYINDFFPKHAEIVLKTLQLAQYLGKPTALVGQGIGPLSNKRLRNLASQVFNKVNLIGLREGKLGTKILREFGVDSKKVLVTGDDAIEAVYKNRTALWGNNIGINLRISSYSPVDQQSIDIIRSVLGDFAKNVGSKLQPIPISFYSAESDLTSIESLLENYEDLCLFENIPKQPTPESIIKIAGTCRLVVTGSYHAAVFALSQGVPVIGLSKSEYYVAKFEGLKKQFKIGITSLLIESPTFEKELKNALQNTWESAEQYKEELLISAKQQIELGIELYSQLFELINLRNK